MLGPWAVREEPNYDKDWAYYFDTREEYEAALAVKREVDPHRIFCANPFAIGAHA